MCVVSGLSGFHSKSALSLPYLLLKYLTSFPMLTVRVVMLGVNGQDHTVRPPFGRRLEGFQNFRDRKLDPCRRAHGVLRVSCALSWNIQSIQ